MNKEYITAKLGLTLLVGLIATANTHADCYRESLLMGAPDPEHPNRFGLNYRLGVNVAVDFKGLGGFPAMTDPGPTGGGGIDRTYDDGYNHVDSSGNAGGLTWNWGYGGGGQVPGDDTILMNSSSSTTRRYENDVDDGIMHGVELTYRRDLRPFERGRLGFESAFAFDQVSVEDNSTHTGTTTTLTDSFELNGVIPPLALYPGTYGGPGPVIGDNPTRSLIASPDTTIIAGNREYDANIFSFRMGPYWEVPFSFNHHLAASISGGLALAVIDSEFSYTERVTINGVGTVNRSGSGSETDLVAGGYVAFGLDYEITHDLHIAGGVQYMNLGHIDHKEDDKKAVLDFDDSIFFTLGLGWSF